MIAETTYHIYNHANGTENLFKEYENYRYFLRQYEKYIHPVAETYAYCLLPNHFHFLIRVRNPESLYLYFKKAGKIKSESKTFPKFETLEKLISKQLSNLFSSYTQAFNKKYHRRGSLFEKNFKRKPIESLSQLQDTFLYINLNSVKHRFTDQAINWKWSSLEAYLNLNKTSLLSRQKMISSFDDIENLKFCLSEKSENILNMDLE